MVNLTQDTQTRCRPSFRLGSNQTPERARKQTIPYAFMVESNQPRLPSASRHEIVLLQITQPWPIIDEAPRYTNTWGDNQTEIGGLVLIV